MLLAKPRLLSVAVGRRVFREGMAVTQHFSWTRRCPPLLAGGAPASFSFRRHLQVSESGWKSARPIAAGQGAILAGPGNLNQDRPWTCRVCVCNVAQVPTGKSEAAPRLMLLRLPTGAAPHDAGTGSLPACENIKTRTRACPHPAGAVECPEWRKRRKGGERAPAARDCRDSGLCPPGPGRLVGARAFESPRRLGDGVSPTDSRPIDSETALLRSPALRPRRAGRSSLPQSTAAGRASWHTPSWQCSPGPCQSHQWG